MATVLTRMGELLGGASTVDGGYVDSAKMSFGTSVDCTLLWDGTYMAAGSGMWIGSPSPLDPAYHSLVHEYYNDFRHLTLDYDATNEWALTEMDAACTQAITADATCGELLLTNKATTDDNAQQIVMAQQSFAFATGKKLWYETRLKTAAGATQVDMVAGLINAEDLTAVADNLPANGVVFYKTDGATDTKLGHCDNNVDIVSAASIFTWTTAYIILGFYFDGGATGAATITPWVNGVAKTALPAVTYGTLAKVAPFFMVRNGDATTTQTLTIDYVKVVQLR